MGRISSTQCLKIPLTAFPVTLCREQHLFCHISFCCAISLEFGKALIQDIILEHKSLEDPQLDKPHSATFGDPHPMSFAELGVGLESSFNPYLHGSRDPNAKDYFEPDTI